MSNSTKVELFKKPRADFPLYPHRDKKRGTARWAKKVRRTRYYFGNCEGDEDGQKALAEWLRTKDDLLAGRKRRPKDDDSLTVAGLCNHFLTAKDRQLASGDLSYRMRADYGAICDRIVGAFGRSRRVDDLTADDFDKLRADVAKIGGPHHVGNVVQRVRTVFKFAYETGLIDRPVRHGPTFKKPSRRTMRLAKAEAGPKLFSGKECRKLIDAADVHLAAMIYLSLNCGLGNSDIGNLPLTAIDLKTAWLDFPRPKTGIERRCPLWPETITAIMASLAKRPKPKVPEAEPLTFVTKYGMPWAKQTATCPMTQAFRKLLGDLSMHRNGRNYYSLRHTFRTVADESRDQAACDYVMGHSRDDMASVYREKISDERLLAVVEHVRKWLPKPRRRR